MKKQRLGGIPSWDLEEEPSDLNGKQRRAVRCVKVEWKRLPSHSISVMSSRLKVIKITTLAILPHLVPSLTSSSFTTCTPSSAITYHSGPWLIALPVTSMDSPSHRHALS
jgi:hypothetical protein